MRVLREPFDQDHITGLDQATVPPLRESRTARCGFPASRPRLHSSQPVHRRSADRDQQIDAAGRAAASLVQIASGVTELLHFAEHRDAPAGGRRGRERAQHHVHRRGTGVVGVVDHRHAAAARTEPRRVTG